MNTSSEKIGELLNRLFSKGFSNEAIHFIIDNRHRKHPEREKIFFDLQELGYCHEFDEFRNIKRIYSGIKEYILDENPKLKSYEEYIIPPLNPFDLFAISSTLLLKSGAYHHIEYLNSDSIKIFSSKSRELNRIVGVDRGTIKEIKSAAKEWRSVLDPNVFYNKQPGLAYASILHHWSILLQSWDIPVYKSTHESNEPAEWWRSAYWLMAVSDEASQDVGFKFRSKESEDAEKSTQGAWPFLAQEIINFAVKRNRSETTAWKGAKFTQELFSYVESLSLADRSIVNVMPKSKTASVGYTLRALSHNLANLPGRGSIRVGWGWGEQKVPEIQKHIFNMILIPYPYKIHSTHFKPTSINTSKRARFGKFTMHVASTDEEDKLFYEYVCEIIAQANKKTTGVHAVILPELALMGKSANNLLEEISKRFSTVELFCSGVRSHPKAKKGFDDVFLNGAYMATLGPTDDKEKKQSSVVYQRLFHEKHHPWKLDEAQILLYNLSSTLDPSRTWIEDLHVVNRKIPFLVMRNKWTVTSLICEDLARNDPARPIVESIGPNLVISLLLDGPQIPQRWSSKYSNVLAEDPGSSVLSLTSLGLMERTNEQIEWSKSTDLNSQVENSLQSLRTIALWRDDRQSKAINIDSESDAVLLSLSEYPANEITIDGRLDHRATSLRLTGVRQIQIPRHSKSVGQSIRKKFGGDYYPRWGRGASHRNDK